MKTRQIRLKSAVVVGDDISDGCYFKRNVVNAFAPITGKWYPESILKTCLGNSSEPDWWKVFPDCTSSDQCYWDARKKNNFDRIK